MLFLTILRISAVLVGMHPTAIGGGGAHVPVLLRPAASPHWWGAIVDYLIFKKISTSWTE